MTTLLARELEVGYRRLREGKRKLIGPVNLTLRPGVLTCLLGPNGIGKSTLLRTLSGLQAPLSGEVMVGEKALKDLPPRELARCMSLVLTERAPVGTLPLWSLVAMGRHPHTDWRGRLTEKDNAVVERAIQMMGLTALAQRPMNAVSDGERQKAMIARALAQEPEILILDEAMAFLDLPRRVELMQFLRDLAKDSGCAILLSCHDLDITLRYADRLWLISHDGRLREGIPEDLVLSGDFETTFHVGDSLSFDPYVGAFVPARSPIARVAVQGAKLETLWASRALERVGFEIVHEDPEWHVTMSEASESPPKWRLAGRTNATGLGLESLLSTLMAPSGSLVPEAIDERH